MQNNNLIKYHLITYFSRLININQEAYESRLKKHRVK